MSVGRVEAILRGRWSRPPSLFARALLGLPAAVLAVHARKRRQRTRRTGFRPDIPLLVVGNLTVGGNGKTPVTLWAAEEAWRRGHRVGIVVRSYRARTRSPVRVSADSDPDLVGDEALLLARRLPQALVMAGPTRRETVLALLAVGGIDLLVSDDGLQHPGLLPWRVWLCLDGTYGFGNARVLPLGPLREPIDPELFGSETQILVKDPTAPGRLHLPWEPARPPRHFRLVAREAVRLVDGLRRPLSSFRGRLLEAWAGIAAPEGFFALLRSEGLDPRTRSLGDHVSPARWNRLGRDVEAVMMTEKDAVKLSSAGADPRLWYVPVEVAFAAADAHALGDELTDLVYAGAAR